MTTNNKLVFAAVADDDTGASDLAGMLAGQKLRTLLVIDVPTVEQFLKWSENFHAVVMALGTRNRTPAEARERTRTAIRILETRRPRVFQIKYCSTFDSTDEGNIGATIEAAMDELNEDFTIALPALPVNGRTTYQGYHFVGGRLLSDSPMRNHPLTPMTNSDLVDLLTQQTNRRVESAAFDVVEAGAPQLNDRFESLRAQGVAVAIVDCLNDSHVETICRAAADLRLVTGSSAFGMKLPAIWRERGWISDLREHDDAIIPATSGSGCLLVAGSCSVATREQNEWLRAQGTLVINISPIELLSNDNITTEIAARVRAELKAGKHCLLTTTNAPDEVRSVQEWGAGNGWTIPKLGQALSSALADAVLAIMEPARIGGLIVAGGETSGAMCRRLEMGALQVGRNIEPGVPLCFSLGKFRLPVVLKSGNFGGTDFYGKALDAISQPAAYMV